MYSGQRLYQVHTPNFLYHAKRTEIPFYSDRLNKRIQEYTLCQRIVDYFQNLDKKDEEYALNTLLSKSFQNKLNLSASLHKEFNLNNYVNISLLDALMRSVVQLIPINTNSLNNNNEDSNNQQKYKFYIKPNNLENISKVIGIIRNSILQPGNDLVIASNPTVIEFLIEISHNYYNFRRSLSSSLGPMTEIKENKYQLTSTISQYIMEILSKTISKVPFYDLINNNTSTENDLIYTNARKVIIGSGIREGWILSNLRNDTVTRAIEVIKMSIYSYDNDDELLASLETLEQVLLSAKTRILIKDSILKPIYDQFIFDNNSNNNNNNSINNNNNDPTILKPESTKTYHVDLEKAKQVLDSQPCIIGRLVELLGHLHNGIQLSSLNILIRMSKSSHKSRIMIANYPGIIRTLLNLLSLKSGENFELSKRAAHLLFNFSKETLNLPLLLEFEHTISQIALSDNPHIDIVAKILVKLETTNGYNINNNINTDDILSPQLSSN